jgi:Methyltransferase domain
VIRSLLLTLPIIERMRGVEGWLTDREADLLIAGAARALAALPAPHVVLEVGSYCGRSTTVLGSVVKALSPEGRVYAVDPHEGEVGSLDQRVVRTAPTLARFRDTMARADLSDVVVSVCQRSYEVEWERPVTFLLIDGLHDYASVSRDFGHFEPWLSDGAHVAFHDYADYYPGVRMFVDELLDARRYERIHLADSLMLGVYRPQS